MCILYLHMERNRIADLVMHAAAHHSTIYFMGGGVSEFLP